MQPYSLISAKNRTLSPSALLLYTEIEASIGREADGAALRHAMTSA